MLVNPNHHNNYFELQIHLPAEITTDRLEFCYLGNLSYLLY